MKLAELAVPFAAVLFFAVAHSADAAEPAAASLKEPGAMLREGTWGGVGAYGTSAFDGLALSAWPKDGWFRLMIGENRIDVSAAPAEKGKAPVFMRSILKQLENSQSETPADTPAPELSEEQARAIYLRVPGGALHDGSIPVYLFKNGTARLFPKLDNRYELTLGTQQFSFTVQNGLRSKNGTPYGEGAHYRIEYDGQVYEYDLDGFGWGSSIEAITDLDGDGKPDFIINVDGNNSGAEYILLSSKAKPGKNPPTASLGSSGC
jgi:hypothetical protein